MKYKVIGNHPIFRYITETYTTEVDAFNRQAELEEVGYEVTIEEF